MARIGSAHPRGESASAQTWLTGLGMTHKPLKEALASDRWLQITAGLHLTAIAAAVVGPASPPLPIFLTLTGLALIVLAFTRAQSVVERPETPAQPVGIDLERQSQRLVEIADAASRARREAEMRGQLWAELTARMSHELRTPLNAVIGFSDLMEAELFGPLGHDRYRDYTRHIRECSRALLKSTEDTLALTSSLARPGSGEVTTDLCLTELLRDAAAFHAAEAKARGLTVILPESHDLMIAGEARPVRQILVNLLAEAHARARRGATITVTVSDDGGAVLLAIDVAKAQPRPDEGQASLAICIARVLLEQSGSGLIESDDHETWHLRTYFDAVAQADFFAQN